MTSDGLQCDDFIQSPLLVRLAFTFPMISPPFCGMQRVMISHASFANKTLGNAKANANISFFDATVSASRMHAYL